MIQATHSLHKQTANCLGDKFTSQLLLFLFSSVSKKFKKTPKNMTLYDSGNSFASL
jgi:hypothetical protein